MIANDFSYDGRYLSDYGLQIVSFDSDYSKVVKQTGIEVKLSTYSTLGKTQYFLTGYKPDKVATASFQIARIDNNKAAALDANDIEFLYGWLQQPRYKRTVFVSDTQDTVYDNSMYWMGTFTKIDPITLDGDCIGLTLTFTADSPYARRKIVSSNKVLSTESDFIRVASRSNIVGIKPIDYMKVVCLRDGDLTLKVNDRVTFIAGCKTGEVITLSDPIIQTSYEAHLIADMFNYVFPALETKVADGTNIITASLPCMIDLETESFVNVGLM